MRPKHVSAVYLASLLLTGCSTTPADLDAKSEPKTQSYSENYQEIYRRVSSTAKRCIAGNITGYASMAVDTELYPDLGYGEATVSMINVGVRNYYLTARIEKSTPSGSKMTIKSGNTLASERTAQTFFSWAAGDPNCPLI